MTTLLKLRRSIGKRLRKLADSESFTPSGLIAVDKRTVRLGSPNVYSHELPVDTSQFSFPGRANTTTDDNGSTESAMLRSCLCVKEQLESPAFRYWASALKEDFRLHRKLWEFCYILQSLYERGMLTEGKRGLGFAVGEEPLPSLMAQMGCEILASDLDSSDERAGVWAETAQLASTLEGLNERQLCEDSLFRERVSFQPIDMNKIPDDIQGFDFTWSSCSFEHCGSIGLGKRFLREQMKCLKPGGVAVHTTEYNLSSLEETIDEGTTVVYRRQDIESMIRDLQSEGHEVEPLQLFTGRSKEDSQIDLFPYSENPHLKLHLFDRYVSTSVGLIIRKSGVENKQKPDSKAA